MAWFSLGKVQAAIVKTCDNYMQLALVEGDKRHLIIEMCPRQKICNGEEST